MKRIERIYILTNVRDVHLAFINVASIRYWYPEIPVSVIEDQHNGAFHCPEITRRWKNVEIRWLKNRATGQGFARYELFSQPQRERCLILDADIVFSGPVLSELEKVGADFVISPVAAPDPSDKKWLHNYYNFDRARERWPEFQFPGYGFNSGQMVATTGIIPRSFWDEFLEDVSPMRLKHKEIFRYDQALWNFALPYLAQKGVITIGTCDFVLWGFLPEYVDRVSLDQVKERISEPRLIHWAGGKPVHVSRFPKTEILQYFEDQHYEKIRWAGAKRGGRFLHRLAMAKYGNLYYRITGKHRYV